jgi:hypothetical protein
MKLNELKRLVMQQALEKGFGVRPREVNVPEKILLIASEVEEAEFFEREHAELCDAISPLDIKWKTNPRLSENTRQRLFHLRGEYEKEMGDILQRTLHLGGIFGYSFINPRLTRDDKSCSDSMYAAVMQIYGHYRKKRMPEFKQGLVGFAYYCTQVAEGSFDIYRTVLRKIEDNRCRVWKKSRLNEKLVG